MTILGLVAVLLLQELSEFHSHSPKENSVKMVLFIRFSHPSIQNFKVPMAFYILNMSVYVQLEILTPKYCLSLLDISREYIYVLLLYVTRLMLTKLGIFS